MLLLVYELCRPPLNLFAQTRSCHYDKLGRVILADSAVPL